VSQLPVYVLMTEIWSCVWGR